MIEVVPIETPTLGDRSYLASDGEVALVIDPQRDIDRVTALAVERGVRITHVAETQQKIAADRRPAHTADHHTADAA